MSLTDIAADFEAEAGWKEAVAAGNARLAVVLVEIHGGQARVEGVDARSVVVGRRAFVAAYAARFLDKKSCLVN